jgi:hypothetical protein
LKTQAADFKIAAAKTALRRKLQATIGSYGHAEWEPK